MSEGDIAELYGGQGINTEEERDQSDGTFTPLGAGWWPVEIEDAEIRDNNKKTGKILNLTMEVLESEAGFAGRKLFRCLNLLHPNADCQKIGRAQAAKVGFVCGIEDLTDTRQFLEQKLKVRLSVKDDPKYGLQNEVKDFKRIDEETPPPEAPPQQQPEQATAAAPAEAKEAPKETTEASSDEGKMPWEK